jgi:glycine/D-amino acid oxidase-like deaminating enzyme/nitrite reductase/ring-hydroxylating ferredoxin subunit
MNTISLWKATAKDSSFPVLNGDISVDVAIIGGGITGITAAIQLNAAGLKTAVVDTFKVGESTTGYSTGNLYTATDQHYHKISAHFGDDILRAVASARQTGLDFIRDMILRHSIECEYTSQLWSYYTERPDHVHKIEQEYECMLRAGLTPTLVDSLHLPFPVKKAVVLEGQARFNPMQYIKALADYAAQQGVQIYENTKMLDVDDTSEDSKEPSLVQCENGNISARYVIEATHIPKGFYIVQAALGAYRSYAIAAKLKEEDAYPHGAYWDTNPDYHHSTTSHKGIDGQYLVIVGAGHKTGQKENNLTSFAQLEEYARNRYPVESVEYTWAAQHYRPADGLPSIGKSPFSNIYIATGFSADGLVWGSFAGLHIASQINGNANEEWNKAFNPSRFTPIASAKDVIKENVNNAVEMFKDYIAKSDFEKISEVQPGEGKLVEADGQKLAVYCNEDGEFTVLDAVCPHMKCIVHWNMAEQTWDCPCHGSRFSKEGRCLEGPAIADLAKKSFDKVKEAGL